MDLLDGRPNPPDRTGQPAPLGPQDSPGPERLPGARAKVREALRALPGRDAAPIRAARPGVRRPGAGRGDRGQRGMGSLPHRHQWPVAQGYPASSGASTRSIRVRRSGKRRALGGSGPAPPSPVRRRAVLYYRRPSPRGWFRRSGRVQSERSSGHIAGFRRQMIPRGWKTFLAYALSLSVALGMHWLSLRFLSVPLPMPCSPLMGSVGIWLHRKAGLFLEDVQVFPSSRSGSTPRPGTSSPSSPIPATSSSPPTPITASSSSTAARNAPSASPRPTSWARRCIPCSRTRRR